MKITEVVNHELISQLTFDTTRSRFSFTLQAILNGQVIGEINYSIMGHSNLLVVDNFNVVPKYRRQGVGSALYDYLQDEYPPSEYNWGRDALTASGAAFHAARGEK